MERQRGAQAGEIAARLRDEIVSGAIEGGARLGQDALAARFSVSRMPVREALRLLEAQGLVDVPPNRSAIVARLSRDDLVDIFDMRACAEPLALGLALPHLTNAQIDRAAEIQREIENAPLDRFGDLNAEFHRTLHAPCGRPRLLAHIESLNALADRYLRLAIGTMDHQGPSDDEHHALLEACRARDEASARAVLTAHIMRARDALAAAFDERAHEPDREDASL
ncbi:GntR family transcriptional regulator [Roseitalea porphyridii]|uniref:GntR family transcriptional regulator n=1 Tax=Roseitalea porphyridii TaxID=1852022 RepID=A0A4P6V1A7_9HYPH|nr:GntR family transcriptional regulator [Roseitalea porphyridii]QBK30160.1 GntR family transcriptional regulator [Roseitalea porphyridii]